MKWFSREMAGKLQNKFLYYTSFTGKEHASFFYICIETLAQNWTIKLMIVFFCYQCSSFSYIFTCVWLLLLPCMSLPLLIFLWTCYTPYIYNTPLKKQLIRPFYNDCTAHSIHLSWVSLTYSKLKSLKLV